MKRNFNRVIAIGYIIVALYYMFSFNKNAYYRYKAKVFSLISSTLLFFSGLAVNQMKKATVAAYPSTTEKKSPCTCRNRKKFVKNANDFRIYWQCITLECPRCGELFDKQFERVGKERKYKEDDP